MGFKTRRFIILLSMVALIQAEGSGNEFPTDPPLHPFESLGMLTKIFIYLGILLVGLTLVIAALSCFVCSCVLYKRGWRNTGEQQRGTGEHQYTDDNCSTRTFSSFRSHYSTTATPEAIQNEHFDHGQETSDPVPAPTTISSSGIMQDSGGVLRVPSAPAGSKRAGSTRSTSSNPDKIMNASNRMASSVTHSLTMPGAVHYETTL